MRVITAAPPADGPLVPIPAVPAARESIAATWSREIATGVGDALGADIDQAAYRLALRADLPVPHTLHTSFTVAGHQVTITVVWDEPWREPAFALTVDDQPVALDTTSTARPAVVLAHAAWQTITDTERAIEVA
jgi:hypothetical protein